MLYLTTYLPFSVLSKKIKTSEILLLAFLFVLKCFLGQYDADQLRIDVLTFCLFESSFWKHTFVDVVINVDTYSTF